MCPGVAQDPFLSHSTFVRRCEGNTNSLPSNCDSASASIQIGSLVSSGDSFGELDGDAPTERDAVGDVVGGDPIETEAEGEFEGVEPTDSDADADGDILGLSVISSPGLGSAVVSSGIKLGDIEGEAPSDNEADGVAVGDDKTLTVGVIVGSTDIGGEGDTDVGNTGLGATDSDGDSEGDGDEIGDGSSHPLLFRTTLLVIELLQV